MENSYGGMVSLGLVRATVLRFPIEENRGVARENHDFLSSCSFIAFQAFLKRLKKSMLLVLFTASGCVFITYC
jgi:hypothetical protein